MAGLALILLNQRTEEPPAGSTPTTVTDSSPTTAAASALEGIPVYTGLGSGQFVASLSVAPYAFTLPEGWNDAGQTEDRLTLCPDAPEELVVGDCIEAIVAILRLNLGSVEQTRDYLAGLDGAQITDVEVVAVGGAEGIRFGYTNEIAAKFGGQVQPDLDVPLAGVGEDNSQSPIGHGRTGRSIVTIVDVAGETMTLVYQGQDPSRTGGSRDAFSDNREEGLAIIDSIVWGDLN